MLCYGVHSPGQGLRPTAAVGIVLFLDKSKKSPPEDDTNDTRHPDKTRRPQGLSLDVARADQGLIDQVID